MSQSIMPGYYYFYMNNYHGIAGCYYNFTDGSQRYLPLVKSSVHTTIFSDRQQTTIKQTFTNSSQKHIDSCKYSFPIYEGVSVTGFTCEIAGRKLIGVVKEKAEAKAEYDAAVSQGKKAGLLEQSDTSDVFSTSLGNVEVNQDVLVTITYIGELKNDLDSDNIRLTIPTHIAPRYGSLPEALRDSNTVGDQGMNISIDVVMPEGKPILGLESPSHPISVSLGRLSTDPSDHNPSFSKASAVLSDTSSGLLKDFVFLIKAKETGNPTAVLQTHPTLKNHRSLMVSLVPKFSLPSIRPEIVFVADRSGSMEVNIPMLRQAMNVFLKSIPAGVKFNICSFGSLHSFLWPKSQSYTKDNLNTAIDHVKTFQANYGGTNTLDALQATISNRYTDIPLEIILLTDGDIWAQEAAFDAINKAVDESKHQIRLFPLGIGDGVSHSLIEGLARAGNGFAQAVQLNERIDTRVVRMLKAALTPHVNNYSLEVKYDTDDDFELIEAVNDCLKLDLPDNSQEKQSNTVKPTVSLFNTSADPDTMEIDEKSPPLPATKVPKLLQAPYNIPSLYSFSRTTVYILMSPDTIQRNPVSVILKGESEHGPLRLEIPVTTLDIPGEAISQLAARKAVQDLEEHRGWTYHATNSKGKKLVDIYPSRASDLVKQEAVRLGTTYGIANKWCSFIAIDADSGLPSTSSDPDAPPEIDEDDEDDDHSFKEVKMKSQGLPSIQNMFTSPRAAPPPPPAPTGSATVGRARGLKRSSLARSQAPDPMASQNYLAATPVTRDSKQYSNQSLAFSPQSRAKASLAPQAAPATFQQSQAIQLQDNARARAVQSAFLSSSIPQQRQMFINLPEYRFAMLATPPTQQPHPAAAKPQPPTGILQSHVRSNYASSSNSSYNSKRCCRRFSKDQSSHNASATYYPFSTPSEETYNSRSDPPASSPTTPAEKVHALIALQDFDGFWAPSADIMEILGLGDARPSYGDDPCVWSTVLVVKFLRGEMAAEREIWELVVDKADEWLAAQGVG